MALCGAPSASPRLPSGPDSTSQSIGRDTRPASSTTGVAALGGFACIDPVYRRWLSVENADRAALRKNPDLPDPPFRHRPTCCSSVGRWKEAAAHSKKFDRKRWPFPSGQKDSRRPVVLGRSPVCVMRHWRLLCRRWPQHPQVWQNTSSISDFSADVRPRRFDLLTSGAERPLRGRRRVRQSGERDGRGLNRQNLSIGRHWDEPRYCSPAIRFSPSRWRRPVPRSVRRSCAQDLRRLLFRPRKIGRRPPRQRVDADRMQPIACSSRRRGTCGPIRAFGTAKAYRPRTLLATERNGAGLP